MEEFCFLKNVYSDISKTLAKVLSAVYGMEAISQSIFLFILRRTMDTLKNTSVKIPLGDVFFLFLGRVVLGKLTLSSLQNGHMANPGESQL